MWDGIRFLAWIVAIWGVVFVTEHLIKLILIHLGAP